jgi:hypothetical protein
VIWLLHAAGFVLGCLVGWTISGVISARVRRLRVMREQLLRGRRWEITKNYIESSKEKP